MTAHEWEIRVAGVLPDSVLAELKGLAVTFQPATTVLCGRLEDEAALHGVLDRVQALSLRLVEVRQMRDLPGTDLVSGDRGDGDGSRPV